MIVMVTLLENMCVGLVLDVEARACCTHLIVMGMYM